MRMQVAETRNRTHSLMMTQVAHREAATLHPLFYGEDKGYNPAARYVVGG